MFTSKTKLYFTKSKQILKQAKFLTLKKIVKIIASNIKRFFLQEEFSFDKIFFMKNAIFLFAVCIFLVNCASYKVDFPKDIPDESYKIDDIPTVALQNNHSNLATKKMHFTHTL